MKLLIIILILLTGCTKEKIQNKTIEYGEKTTLYDLIKNESITSPNIEIIADKLETRTIEYKINNKKVKIKLKITDTTKPLLQVQNTYYIEQNKNFDIKKVIFFGDNYDREPKLEIIGQYDTTKLGTYNLKIKVTDKNGNKTEKETKIIVEKKQNQTYTQNKYKFEDFKNNYKDYIHGIDVSVWQGDVDFQKVKEAGCEFVMIRIGYGPNSDNSYTLDKKFKQNIKNAKEAGLQVGVYFYSYATTKEEAKKEANWIIETLNNEKLELPIAFDWESWTSFDDYHLNFLDINNIAASFMDECLKQGYDTMLYSSLNYLNNVWNLDEYKIWLAHYTKQTTYDKEYLIWQNSSIGTINGINGYVDLDLMKKR